MKSEYITVEVVERDNRTERHKVRYWLPDVFHYERALEHGHLSNETANTIRSFSPTQLEKPALRQKLNRMITMELTESYLSRTGGLSNLCQGLQYIQPLADSTVSE